ncbi:MAG: histidine kinase [Actinomycetota bacterium]
MSRRTASRLAWSLCAVAVAAIVGGFVLQSISPQESLPPGIRSSLTERLDSLTNLGLPVIGALVASRRPKIALGWLFLLAGLGLGVSTFGQAYAAYALLVDPGSLPAPYAVAWVSNWSWTLGVGALPFLLLLFPTGMLHSRRWRTVFWGAAICSATLLLTALIASAVLWSQPFLESASFDPLLEGVAIGAVYATLAFSVLGVVSQLLRLRQARGEERQQLKWFVTATALFVAILVVQSIVDSVALTPLLSLATLGLYMAIGIAILKYRLYDIDIVISKTLVFGALAAFFTVVYVAVVVGIGALVGARANTLLTIVAAVVIAVAFHPVREWARHLANRLVYGRRATPYEVLSQFSERMAGTYAVDEILPRLAQILGEGTGASRAGVWLRVGGELRLAASWPTEYGARAALPVGREKLPEIPETTRAAAVRHQGELLGALAIAKPPSEPLTPTEDKLLSDLASQAGLVLRNVRLIEELRASRQRIVAAQDEERRRIERNIHDGAQQQLVSLSVKLALVRAMAKKDIDRADSMLEELQSEAGDALDNLRDLARGIYPPLLADQGLLAALEAHTRKVPLPVQIQADGVRRYLQEAEAAVYFCCLEALQNVAKYAGASRAIVALTGEDGHVVFSVQDDGIGFDPDRTPSGSGLTNMADRLAALGGALEVTSRPGHGTTITGRVPVRAKEAVG